MKQNFKLGVCIGSLVLAAATLALDDQGDKTHKITTISPRKMADSLHAVIAADREAYSRLVVERLGTKQAAGKVSERWFEEGGFPVHAQILRAAGTSIQKKGAEFSYTLRSLWPINQNQGPQTEIENRGLAAVRDHPDTPFYSDEMLGGRGYFTAIYSDRAILPTCVECHNQHPSSPRRDFKLNDVMGAIVVRVPLEF